MADPLEQIVNRARQEGIELENIKFDIKTNVNRELLLLDATYRIPLNLFINGNYQELVEDMLEFLLPLPGSG